jgi:NAD(P)-dependent dehydrogenase (short-subunit alcohol dehydrogenase family)
MSSSEFRRNSRLKTQLPGSPRASRRRPATALSLVEELRVDEWNQMIDVNLRGVLHGIAAVLPIMLIWKSAANGSDAAARIMDEMGHSPVHAVIDQRSVVWRIAQVRQQTTSKA